MKEQYGFLYHVQYNVDKDWTLMSEGYNTTCNNQIVIT